MSAHQSQLLAIFGNRDTDLASNRSGKLSQRQHQLLDARAQRPRRQTTAIMVLGVALLIVSLVIGMVDSMSLALIIVGAVGVALLAAGLFLRQALLARIRADRELGAVDSVQGLVEKKQGASWREPAHVRLEGHIIYVPKAIFPALQDDERYIIYYTPQSRTAVAMELEWK